jgi:diketogulonate reductase-like aldo/keto reductase
MEELHREGLVRNIGVSNWTVALLSDLLSYATVKPLVNQFEMHPYYPREALIDMCKRNGIIPQAYRVIGGDSASDLLRDETIAEVAKICNVTPAQVIINWVLRNNCCVVVKASSSSRLYENFSSQDIYIPSNFLANISKISTRRSFCDPKVLFGFALFD